MARNVFFLIKTVLNREIRAKYVFSLEKSRFKPGTVLIETVLSGDPLYTIGSDIDMTDIKKFMMAIF